MRFAESSSASSIGRPSRLSANTRCSSRRVGSDGFLGDLLEALGEGEAGAHRAGEEVQHVRQLRLELAQATLRAAARRHATGPMTASHGQHERRRDGEQQRRASEDHEDAAEVEEQRLGRAQREVGLLELVLDTVEQPDARRPDGR